jgi:transcriptional/translational regulatory protein YebC/TACO1
VVGKALGERKWSIASSKLIWKAKNPVTLDDDAKRAEVEAFLEAIDDDDDVQAIYVALA